MKLLPSVIERIAVLRANAIGDFVLALPALQALKRAFPAARLTLLGQAWHQGFLRQRPGPWDEVLAIPSGCLEADPAPATEGETAAFFARMRRCRFDLAVQLHGGGRDSNHFVRDLEARYSIGRCTPDAPRLDRWLAFHHYQHEISRHLDTVALVGADATVREPVLAVTNEDRRQLQQVFPDTASPYVVLHAGAGDARRRWPAARFAAVARWLQQQGLRVVLSGQGHEGEAVREVQRLLHGRAEMLCDRLSLEALLALLENARLVIANDTGPAHLARAVGTATVTVFWGPNLITAAPLSRRHHRVAISWQMRCPCCGHDYGEHWPYAGRDCGHRESLLQAVPEDEVIEAAQELLHGF